VAPSRSPVGVVFFVNRLLPWRPPSWRRVDKKSKVVPGPGSELDPLWRRRR
jgi:hypothetical protein